MKNHEKSFPINLYYLPNNLGGFSEKFDELQSDSFVDETKASDLGSIIKSLWFLFFDITEQQKKLSDSTTRNIYSILNEQKSTRNPNIFLNYYMDNHGILSVNVESKIYKKGLSGRVGFIISSEKRQNLLNRYNLLSEFVVEVDPQHKAISPKKSSLHPFVTEMLQFFIEDEKKQKQMEYVRHWLTEVEEKIMVPTDSLRDITSWLSNINQDIVSERENYVVLAERQQKQFNKTVNALST